METKAHGPVRGRACGLSPRDARLLLLSPHLSTLYQSRLFAPLLGLPPLRSSDAPAAMPVVHPAI